MLGAPAGRRAAAGSTGERETAPRTPPPRCWELSTRRARVPRPEHTAGQEPPEPDHFMGVGMRLAPAILSSCSRKSFSLQGRGFLAQRRSPRGRPRAGPAPHGAEPGEGGYSWGPGSRRCGCGPLLAVPCPGRRESGGAPEMGEGVRPWMCRPRTRGSRCSPLAVHEAPDAGPRHRGLSRGSVAAPGSELSWWEREAQHLEMNPLNWTDLMLLNRWLLLWRVRL